MGRGAVILVKWILVPAVLAGVGYVFVGPRLGGELAEKAVPYIKKSGITEKLNPGNNNAAPAKQAEPAESEGPAVRVKVKPATSGS